jgi:hypothetical protein
MLLSSQQQLSQKINITNAIRWTYEFHDEAGRSFWLYNSFESLNKCIEYLLFVIRSGIFFKKLKKSVYLTISRELCNLIPSRWFITKIIAWESWDSQALNNHRTRYRIATQFYSKRNSLYAYIRGKNLITYPNLANILLSYSADGTSLVSLLRYISELVFSLFFYCWIFSLNFKNINLVLLDFSLSFYYLKALIPFCIFV